MQFGQLKRREFISLLGGTAVWAARQAQERAAAKLAGGGF
jgi:hypothetical protein